MIRVTYGDPQAREQVFNKVLHIVCAARGQARSALALAGREMEADDGTDGETGDGGHALDQLPRGDRVHHPEVTSGFYESEEDDIHGGHHQNGVARTGLTQTSHGLFLDGAGL